MENKKTKLTISGSSKKNPFKKFDTSKSHGKKTVVISNQNNKNINEIVWGVIPDYKPNLKEINKEMKSHIELKFERSRFINGQYGLSNLYYNDKNSANALKINFKNRQIDNDYINIKKMWKMLDY